MQSLSALARVLGPAVGGVLYQTISPPAPYLAGALGMVAAAGLSLGLVALPRATPAAASPAPPAATA